MDDQLLWRKSEPSGDDIDLPPCSLCGDDLSATTSYSLLGNPICLRCLLHLGPERAQILLKIKFLDPEEIAAAVTFLRGLLTRNQTMRLREAIRNGGRNWWVKLPEFGEYVCRLLAENGIAWDSDVLDEVWDRLVEEAVEE
jgi:hypothetical protein